MSVRRTPPSDDIHLKTPQILHYGSDPSISVTSAAINPDNFLNIKKRQKRSYNEFSEHSFSCSTEIKAMFDEISSRQDDKFESLTSAMQVIINQNQDIQKSVDFMTNQHEDLLIKMNSLERENNEYKKRVASLERKIDLLEKHTYNSTVEIRNVPKSKSENKQSLTTLIKKISSALDSQSTIADTDIRDIYRSKSAAIVVEFSSTSRKESLVSDYKTHNKKARETKGQSFSSALINVPGTPRPIYISEYLTAKARRVFYMTREAVKNKKLVATWTAYGKVFVKKTEDSEPTRIEEEEDLHKFIM